MQSIITKAYGHTNTHPARILAWTSGNPKTRFPSSVSNFTSIEEAHHSAARHMASKMRWAGDWHGGAFNTSETMVWTCVGKGPYDSFTGSQHGHKL